MILCQSYNGDSKVPARRVGFVASVPLKLDLGRNLDRRQEKPACRSGLQDRGAYNPGGYAGAGVGLRVTPVSAYLGLAPPFSI